LPVTLKNFSNQITTTRPAEDELEISLFGPGVGECIVVHLGENNWMIIDSCLNPETRNPIALDYLTYLGVNPSESVKLIVITHWHSDHINGIGTIVDSCPQMRICYSSALLKKEFIALVNLFSGNNSIVDRNTSTTREMSHIMKTLQKRCNKNHDYNIDKMIPTTADRILFRRSLNKIQVEVIALAPSSKSIHNSLLEFASLMPKPGDLRQVIPSPSPNHNAIPLWVKFGNVFLLLGADLPETTDLATGWSAIVSSKIKHWENGKAIIFKIPHHGSQTAHSQDVWNELLSPEPISILTTKLGGRSSIPKARDIDRIKKLSSSVFSTNEPQSNRIKRDRTVEKTFQGVIKRRKVIGNKVGQIQMRVNLENGVMVNLGSPATEL